MAAHRSGPGSNSQPVGLCCLTSYKPSCSRLSISSSSAAAIGAKQVYLSEMLPWPSMHTPPRPRDGSTTKIDPVSPLSSSREFTLLMRTLVGTDGKLIEGAGLLACSHRGRAKRHSCERLGLERVHVVALS